MKAFWVKGLRFINQGMTMIEILIVMGIVMILLGIAWLEFSTWVKKYDIERQIYMLHAQLLKSRSTAMFRNRTHFVVLKEGSFSIIDDTNPSPFGDGVNTSADTVILAETALIHPINQPSTITFNARGLTPLNQTRTICVYSEVHPDADCIVVHRARINIGCIIRQDDVCSSENCRTK
ncbi:MAG TPA: GspH/FimT family protein [Dissulfurispiraceae bacterium]|nr:GspH/FimT family protein [Dissulfurispiraceae bacterium]